MRDRLEEWEQWYERVVLEPNKQPVLLMLLAFAITFLLTRALTRSIRAGRGPGRNMAVGGVHMHHVVIGIVLMVAAGAAGFTNVGIRWPFAEIFAALFGIGAALVLDEFALILRLEDVYWQKEGRTSVDAVFAGAALCALVLVGVHPIGVEERLFGQNPALVEPAWEIFLLMFFNTVVVLIALLKGRFVLGLLGVVVPFIALWGALRLARPRSPWAMLRYPGGSKKLEMAKVRERRFQKSWLSRTRHRIYDAVAGAASPNTGQAVSDQTHPSGDASTEQDHSGAKEVRTP